MPTISRSLVHPVVTPVTALLSRARVSPCSAALESSARVATRWPSCCATVMPAGTRVCSVPFGPCTVTRSPATVTFTPCGMAMGFLPILDITLSSQCRLAAAGLGFAFMPRRLPHFAQDLAAYAFLARLLAGHHAPRGGEDVDPQPAQDARNLGAAHVHPATRARHARQVGDGRLVTRAVLQVDAQQLVAALFRRFEVGDVALLFQDSGNLQLQLRSRDIHFLVPGADGVADPCQEICDRIGHRHALFLLDCPFAPREGEPAAT